LCDLGEILMTGLQVDGTSRHHAGDKDLSLMCMLGTFSHHTVANEASCIKIEDDNIALDRACLLGCGVVTGWGSAVYAAEVGPGDTVVVVGVGGIGANAIQGARLAGAKRIIAIDPVESKRTRAATFGATDTAASLAERAVSGLF
jgi:S-(hydroxymethyl)glutathione dehydrogenase/alcohol dehydrogenase